MFILDINDKIHSDVCDLKSLLETSKYNIFSKILSENKIAESQFIANPSACIIHLDKTNILVCHMRDIAGLRFILLVHAGMNYGLLTDQAWMKMETAAAFSGADLIQVLLPFAEADRLNSFSNVLMENFIFEKDTAPSSLPGQLLTTPIDFNDQKCMQKMAELEFLTRLKFASTTYQPKDNFSVVLEEYLTMGETPGMGGVCIENDPRKGFMIWWSMPEKQSSIGIHLWVSENHRGFGYGEHLLSAMMNQLYLDNIKVCRCFMSALNLSVIKTFLKYDFKLNYFVLNRILK